MAKTTAKAKPAAKKSKRTPPVIERPAYSVPELAKALGIEPASVRVKLRNAGIKKSGRMYDFKSAAGVKAMAAKLGA